MPHVLSCSEACGFFPNKGLNLCRQPGHSTVPPGKSQTIKLCTDFELLRGSVFLTPILLKGLWYSKNVCKIKNTLYDVMELILENSSLDLGLTPKPKLFSILCFFFFFLNCGESHRM